MYIGERVGLVHYFEDQLILKVTSHAGLFAFKCQILSLLYWELNYSRLTFLLLLNVLVTYVLREMQHSNGTVIRALPCKSPKLWVQIQLMSVLDLFYLEVAPWPCDPSMISTKTKQLNSIISSFQYKIVQTSIQQSNVVCSALWFWNILVLLIQVTHVTTGIINHVELVSPAQIHIGDNDFSQTCDQCSSVEMYRCV